MVDATFAFGLGKYTDLNSTFAFAFVVSALGWDQHKTKVTNPSARLYRRLVVGV